MAEDVLNEARERAVDDARHSTSPGEVQDRIIRGIESAYDKKRRYLDAVPA